MNSTDMKKIPTPEQPTIFQMMKWIVDPIGYMTDNFEQYGDIFCSSVLWDSSAPLVMLNEPKAIQHMLTHDTGREFSAPGEVNQLLAPIIGKQNVMMLSGQEHRNRRQLVMPPFHGERLKTYGKLIQSITQEVIEQWPDQSAFYVREAMQKITMRVILEVVFGIHKSDRYQKLERLLSQRIEMSSTLLSSALIFFPWMQKDFGAWSPGGQMKRMSDEIDALIFATIQERRDNPDPNRADILSLLMTAKDEEGHGLSEQALRDELMALLLAGHETTATALTWAFYWIHALPTVKRKLIDEVEQISDSSDPDEFLHLPYLGAVCNETLRIHPVAMLTFPRQVEVPLELCGCHVEPGTLVMGSIYLVHHREDLYPESHQFQPERFLEQQFSPYEFMPFGGGVRRCIGYALAQQEMKIVLGTVMKNLDLELVNKRPVQPGRRGVTLGQKTPIQLRKVGTARAAQPLVNA